MPTAMTVNERFLDIENRVSVNREDIDGLLTRILWEQDAAEPHLWNMREPTAPPLYDRAYIDDVETALSDEIHEVQSNLDAAVITLDNRIDNEIAELDNAKLDKHAGAAHAGKHLAIDAAGMIVPEAPLITGIDETYLAIVNGILGVNALLPERLNDMDAALAAVNAALSGKLDNTVDTALAGQVVTVSDTGTLEPAVSRPLWNHILQKPFSTLKPAHFIVSGDELSVTDRWTGGIAGVQTNLEAETARIDAVNEVQEVQIQQLQNGKLNIPFNSTDGNIAVFSNIPGPGVADTGVKPSDFVRWTQIQRVPVLWV